MQPAILNRATVQGNTESWSFGFYLNNGVDSPTPIDLTGNTFKFLVKWSGGSLSKVGSDIAISPGPEAVNNFAIVTLNSDDTEQFPIIVTPAYGVYYALERRWTDDDNVVQSKVYVIGGIAVSQGVE